MARPNRCDVFDPSEVGIYHCVQRAVRRAYLCGVDKLTGKSFEHRKGWIRRRLEELSGIFGIDCLSFAVMSNHLHVVLRNRPDVVESWTDQEVAVRWWKLFPARRESNGDASEATAEDLKTLLQPKRIAEFRKRLSDLSWWMRALAEPIARRSNREDECTGRFWEGRFKCQKLADETALLACSVYVDLNPVRARIAETPEESEFTSIHERIVAEREARGIPVETKRERRGNRRARRELEKAKQRVAQGTRRDDWLTPIPLDEKAEAYAGAMPNKRGVRASDKGFLAMNLEQYFQLIDWTGRQLRRDSTRKASKRGRIPPQVEPILKRIGLCAGSWCDLIGRFGKIFKRVAGTKSALAREAEKHGRQWYQSSNMPIEMAQA